MKKVVDYLKLIRVKHWLKNFLIFVPLLFSSQLLNSSKFSLSFAGFLSFCLMASAVYIFNDIKDIEKDKSHQKKKKRPLASGTITIFEASVIMIILIIISFLINIIIIQNIYCLFLILIYLILNICYSFGLKNIPIIDVIVLVSVFVLRIVYGASITNIVISKWLYLTVMLGSFFMVFGKRRNEIIKQGNTSRLVLKYYTKDYLDKFMYVSLFLTIVFYSLWSIDAFTVARLGNDYMFYTIPLVFVIFMKYCLDIEGDSYGDPVDVITSDKVLISMILLFTLIMFIIIYVI